jgi:hypothetical protein
LIDIIEKIKFLFNILKYLLILVILSANFLQEFSYYVVSDIKKIDKLQQLNGIIFDNIFVPIYTIKFITTNNETKYFDIVLNDNEKDFILKYQYDKNNQFNKTNIYYNGYYIYQIKIQDNLLREKYSKYYEKFQKYEFFLKIIALISLLVFFYIFIKRWQRNFIVEW